MKAPHREPTAGRAATAPLDGEGAGAEEGPSAATMTLMEAAAKMTAQAIFFISIFAKRNSVEEIQALVKKRFCRFRVQLDFYSEVNAA
ncbi:hypothetical protein SAY86_026888 [Trapa natans]|uniref:Uncharacterized protein n=1 Tax=Trapa natans TaxID=22666 RepID=A0AAN7QJU7_TRANT|nr:hypothetical protein SAY86_026888 [Trapa natans]